MSNIVAGSWGLVVITGTPDDEIPTTWRLQGTFTPPTNSNPMGWNVVQNGSVTDMGSTATVNVAVYVPSDAPHDPEVTMEYAATGIGNGTGGFGIVGLGVSGSPPPGDGGGGGGGPCPDSGTSNEQ